MVQAAKPRDVIPISAPVHSVECAESFGQLSDTEAHYAYFMARAAWEGSKICWFQRSYEAPALFVLLKLVFGQGIAKQKERVLAAGITDEQWKQFMAYSSAVFNNCGNFRSFGDTKFVPELSSEAFWSVVQASAAYATHQAVLDNIWNKVSYEVYSEAEPHQHIGFPDKNGVTSYYSGNCTSDDAKFIDEFCQKEGISPPNTRLFKSADGKTFDLRIASHLVDTTRMPYVKSYPLENEVTVNVTAGDFSKFMAKLTDSIEQAKHYTAGENQRQMLTNYEEHFRYGDIDKHKDSQRNWIKDIGPIVETDIGFIETYLDPSGARAEFEGFVAIVNKTTSAKFNTLVQQAEEMIAKLPWGPAFEKEVFSKPDFTDLDIVAFGCSGTPIGINIPNYDDIRQTEGFKNVNLGNVYPRPRKETIQFLVDGDKDMLVKYSKESLTLIVALHELLGHGTGKLFQLDDQGQKNWDPSVKNPFNGEEITTCYTASETWSQKFGKLHSGYEECRADSVALHLIQFREPFQIFCPDKEAQWDDIYYTCWLEMLYQAIRGLLFYDEENKLWGQAHVLAAWVIFSAVREGDPELISFDFHTNAEGKEWFTMHIKRERIRDHAFPALETFLHKLHVYKSIGDFDTAKTFFDHYSEVDETMMRVRKIVIDNKLPRRLELQPNLKLSTGADGGQEVSYAGYEANHEGIVQSYIERWQGAFMADVYEQWVQDADQVRVPRRE